MFRHYTKPTAFCLCIDDIGLKYYNDANLQHFITAISNHYKYHIDIQGKNYLGLTLDWHYSQGYVDISMPTYIYSLLKRLKHPPPKKPQYSPHDCAPITYLKKGQTHLATTPDTSPIITDKKIIKRIQSIIGSLLYYGRSIDNTILPALNSIAIHQATPTEKKHFNNVIGFWIMCLHIPMYFYVITLVT